MNDAEVVLQARIWIFFHHAVAAGLDRAKSEEALAWCFSDKQLAMPDKMLGERRESWKRRAIVAGWTGAEIEMGLDCLARLRADLKPLQ
jgi:hypothetical protein